MEDIDLSEEIKKAKKKFPLVSVEELKKLIKRKLKQEHYLNYYELEQIENELDERLSNTESNF